MIGWLSSPLSGAEGHVLPAAAAWHGRGMALAWGILIPLGILIARYWKVTPSQRWPEELDNKFWWRWHLRLQYAGMALALAALAAALSVATGATAAARFHALIGWLVIALGIVQILGGLLRGSKGGPTGENAARGDWRGDHYDMTPRRLAFEHAHKFGGFLVLFLSVFGVVTGLVAADAPRWMLLVLVVWWVGLVLVAVRLQWAGRCIDTYQAIWGPDETHPGNRRRPIGLGVRKVEAAPARSEAAEARV